MDMSQYRDLFVSEARSHLSAFSELIVHLEDSPRDSAAINELFRHAHSLKGMAATMGYEQVVVIAHLMEDQLGHIRSGESELLPTLADLLLEGGDELSRLVSLIENGSETFEDSSALAERLAAFNPSEQASPNIFVKVPNEIGVSSTLSSNSASHQFRHSDSLNSIRIKTETLDHLVNITGELITNRYRLTESIHMLEGTEKCKEPIHQLTTLLQALRDEVFKARMLPFEVIAERFPRLVRDLARKQGKEIRFQLEGKEIELDRGILEEIAEPIVHILRNAIDHGLESADERVMGGKPFGGTITLTVRRDKDHVEIIIADDGRGIDSEMLKLKGIEKGIVSSVQAATMTEQELYQLICTPGFSTAATITDVSGRGVGMDVVREVVHRLGGVLTIQSRSGLGSSFIMRLPITVSIIHALIVQCGSYEIAFPLNVVKRTLELKRSEIIVESGRSTIFLEGTSILLRSLRQALNLPAISGKARTLLSTIVCDIGGTLTALAVDHISGEQEIFVRPLRSPLSHLRGLSGATIAGDGRVIFVVDASLL